MNLSRRTLVILAVFAGLFLVGQWFFVPKTYVNSRIIQALQAPKVLLESLRSRHSIVTELSQLTLENQSLRAQLQEIKNQPTILQGTSTLYLNARVYSTYPFNNAGTLLINAGSSHGVKEGAVVLAAPGIFLGEVVSVTESKSEVRTVFDPDWEIPVKIGEAKLDSLLIGGHEPRLTLISKKKPAGSGQTVLLAAGRYPYALSVGSVGELKDSERDLFQEAALKTPYQVSELNDVLIIR